MTLVAMEGDLILLMKDHFPVINDHEVIIFAALSIVNFEVKNQGCKESRPLCKLYCSLPFETIMCTMLTMILLSPLLVMMMAMMKNDSGWRQQRDHGGVRLRENRWNSDSRSTSCRITFVFLSLFSCISGFCICILMSIYQSKFESKKRKLYVSADIPV